MKTTWQARCPKCEGKKLKIHYIKVNQGPGQCYYKCEECGHTTSIREETEAKEELLFVEIKEPDNKQLTFI
jgi:hypothetical protein